METKVKQLAILNLTGELPAELQEYFVNKEIKVVDPLIDKQRADWTHILTKDMHDFSLLRETYKTLENDIKIISLTSVQDLQNFILSNGKLIYDEEWLKGPLGEFILDKFLQEYAGITLGDNYPKFQETGAFNVTNPFNTGEYLDRMVHSAFEHGIQALSIKTFFDHLIMYLAGLKNKNKAGFPIEVSYGIFDEVFGVQIHFYTKSLLLEDVTSSLSNQISKKSEEHLLNVSVQSADFFDFTFLAQVQKVVITGMWTKGDKLVIENRGLMFAALSSSATHPGYATEGVTSGLIPGAEITDASDKIALPESAEGDSISISGEKFTEDLVEKLSSNIGIDKVKQILSGEFDTDDNSEIVPGTVENKEGKVVLNSTDEMNDILNLVKGKIEEEGAITRISGEKFNPDNFAFRVSAGIADKAKDNDVMKVKALGEKLPERIKTGLFDFAKKNNKNVDDLTSEDIEAFREFEIPEIIKSSTVLANRGQMEMLKDIKEKLESNLKAEFMDDSLENIMTSIKTEDDAYRVKQLLKSTLQNSLDKNFHLSAKSSLSKNEQDMLVKSLSSSLKEDENKIREIISTDSMKSNENNLLFKTEPSEADKELLNQMNLMMQENTALKTKMKTLLSEVKILKDSKQQMAEIQMKAIESSKNESFNSSFSDSDEKLRLLFKDRLNQGSALNQQEQSKLSLLLEKESKLIVTVKEEELKARKIQIEAGQKEALFSKEIEKSNRQLKAKDLMLTKTKEALQKITDKKDFEIQDLRQKIDQLTRALANGPSAGQSKAVKDLEKQNLNLTKMLDVYKIKVQSIANNMQTKSDESGAKEEVRRLNMINTQFKNQLETAKRDLSKTQEKLAVEVSQVQTLRQEKAKLENLIKKTSVEVQKETPAQVNLELEQNFKRIQSLNTQLESQLESQLKETSTKIRDLELRLGESMKNQKPTGAQADEISKGKMAQLEGNVKKLTQDLIENKNQLNEMKKETNKLRQEKTALQNQLDKMKKDADKASKKAGVKAA